MLAKGTGLSEGVHRADWQRSVNTSPHHGWQQNAVVATGFIVISEPLPEDFLVGRQDAPAQVRDRVCTIAMRRKLGTNICSYTLRRHPIGIIEGFRCWTQVSNGYRPS